VAKSAQRTFSYRSGVRVRDSVLACDATAGSDLVFLSHALALDARAARLLPRPRSGKRQVLTTDTTLNLLGSAGARLRPHALTPAYGRPFAVGGMRLELFPSGHLPGAASLLCDIGEHRLVYAAPVAAPAAAAAGPPPELRPAQALCIDGTFGQPQFQFPPYDSAIAAVRDHVLQARAAGRAPVVLARPLGPALDVAVALAAAGIVVRAHRQVIAARAAWLAAGLPAPALLRFAGQLAPGEALLWPLEGREAGMLKALPGAFIVLASGWAADPVVTARLRPDASVLLSNVGGFAELLAYVQSTGAREVAIRHAADETLVQTLSARGVDAYRIGPPQQIPLF
jgi:hypothetical protein